MVEILALLDTSLARFDPLGAVLAAQKGSRQKAV
jgi:hypothetical protein